MKFIHAVNRQANGRKAGTGGRGDALRYGWWWPRRPDRAYQITYNWGKPPPPSTRGRENQSAVCNRAVYV